VADFSTLEGIFTSFSPSDLQGTVTPNLGQMPNVVDSSAFDHLRNLLENNGKGVLSAKDLKAKIGDFITKGNAAMDMSQFVSFHSTEGFIDNLGPNDAVAKTYVGPDGTPQQLGKNPIAQMMGADFTMPTTAIPNATTIFCSRSPFFSPMTRNCHRAEIFLNSMPPLVLASLVPFLQAEFNTTRRSNIAPQLQAPGLLKFLLGAVSTTGADNPQTADDAMIGAHQIGGTAPTDGSPPSPEIDYAGMEMFTAPQTLFNPQPNSSTTTGNTPARYADVIDPTRPFASLENATISIVPAGAGFYTYKKATLTIKIHDRSRLSEISDIIRPRVYTGVTVWLTYGWRAPSRPGDNPYFDYVNDNLMMREAYGIINSNFSFDNVGQVSLTLELFTKGVHEMRTSKISDNAGDSSFQWDQARHVGEQIAQLFLQSGLDPTGGSAGAGGLSRETRAFMVLDSAEQGQRPDLKPAQIDAAITQLNDLLHNTKSVDQAKASQLINAMKKYYQDYTIVDPSSKFTLSKSQDTLVTNTVKKMFDECVSGADPFLNTLTQTAEGNGYKGASHDLQAELSAYNTAPLSPNSNMQKAVVSFGKIFTTFAMRNLVSMPGTIDELQVFFYQMNEQCGPVSSTSVAQFPIRMDVFLDQYREHVIRNGGERMTLEDFLSLVINAQFLDPRAVGYKMASAYQPYNSKSPDAKAPDKQGQQASILDAWAKKYGTFKQPIIEMYIEVAHQRPSEDFGTQSDILQLINYSSKDATTMPPQAGLAGSTLRIMRIHIYDKQLNPYKGVGTLLRNAAGDGYIQVPAPANSINTEMGPDFAKSIQAWVTAYKSGAPDASASTNPITGVSEIAQPASYSQAKDIISKMVPTIRFGANGTTITSAHLASKADPRVSTVQMQRTMTITNDASPNGSGQWGFPVRVIPAQLNMTSLGNPLATMAQMYFIDFQTGTTLDNLYIVTGLTHTISPGKFESSWQFGYADAYGVWEGSQQFTAWLQNLATNVPKGKS
jgi:hypothetical protein